MGFQLDKVSVTDGTQRRLAAVSGCIEDGDFLVIVGANGAGKSTLLDVLSGITRVTDGSMQFSGDTRHIAYLYQNAENSLFAGTIAEEFALTWGVSIREVQARASEVMEHLHQFGITRASLEDLPMEWSIGLQRLFAIAVAASTKPRYFLLDEPTAGLDNAHTKQVMEALQALHRAGTTLIVVTHNLDLVKDTATRVWVMSQGTNVFDGSMDDLYRQPDVLVSHGVGLPPSLRLISLLQRHGLQANEQLGGTHPSEVAAALCKFSGPTVQADKFVAAPKLEADAAASTHSSTLTRPFQTKFDARSRWFTTTLIVIVLAIVHGVAACAAGVLATAILLIGLRQSPRRIVQMTWIWLVFAAMTAVIAGLHFGAPFHEGSAYQFNVHGAATGVLAIVPYWCYLQLGQLLVNGSTSIEVQGMVDSLLALARIPVKVRHTCALTAGMAFRFIPTISVMYREQVRAWQTRARGLRSRRFAWLNITNVLSPLLIRLLRYGEVTSDALQARGITQKPIPYASMLDMRLQNRDYVLMGFGLISGIALALCN